MQELINQIIANPLASVLIVINLIIIESLLAVDNAAVLASMVMDLPKDQRGKALRYGIVGAYVFRGICLLFASMLIKIWWLKPLGGLYLIYLFYSWYKKKQTPTPEDDLIDRDNNWFYKNTLRYIGPFWASVIAIEIMDLTFSIDNVFAAVAFSDNIVLIWIGVFIGILAMRFVAQYFVTLMEKYPFLEVSAFVIILILGIKLCMAVFEHFYPEHTVSKFLSSHAADWIFSIITLLIFFVPILINRKGSPKIEENSHK
jgi:YkoY family integral membrane protein